MADALRERTAQLRTRADKALGYRDAEQDRLTSIETEITTLDAEEQLLALVSGLFRSLIDQEVTEGVRAVETLQSEGLQAVFSDMDITVRADVNLQRGQVAVDLLTLQTQPDGSVTEAASLDAYGGSIASVQSVLMRIIVILRRDMRPFLLLDESLAAVAENYVPAVGQFLAQLCERLDMDVLAVSHNPVLVEAAHRAYRIHKVGSVASFKEISRDG